MGSWTWDIKESMRPRAGVLLTTTHSQRSVEPQSGAPHMH